MAPEEFQLSSREPYEKCDVALNASLVCDERLQRCWGKFSYVELVQRPPKGFNLQC